MNPAGKAMKKYAAKTAESTKVDWVVVSVKDLFKWGIKMGSRLCAKPQRKNKHETSINGTKVFDCFFMRDFYFKISLNSIRSPSGPRILKYLQPFVQNCKNTGAGS